VPTPLYRVLIIGAVFSGLMQVKYGPPVSISGTQTPGYFDTAFVVLQILAGLLNLIGLYLVEGNTTHARKLQASLTLELIGLIGMQTVISMNIVAVALYYDEPPSAMGTWFQVMFWLWAWTRMYAIIQAQRQLASS
jgi:hypothetical protein